MKYAIGIDKKFTLDRLYDFSAKSYKKCMKIIAGNMKGV